MASSDAFHFCCSGRLTVSLHRSGLAGLFRRAAPARCARVTLNGITVDCPLALQPGERVVLDITAHDMRVEELAGRVRSAQETDGAARYEIDFEGVRETTTLHCLRHLSQHNASASAA
jgi:hypothetical protein